MLLKKRVYFFMDRAGIVDDYSGINLQNLLSLFLIHINGIIQQKNGFVPDINLSLIFHIHKILIRITNIILVLPGGHESAYNAEVDNSSAVNFLFVGQKN